MWIDGRKVAMEYGILFCCNKKVFHVVYQIDEEQACWEIAKVIYTDFPSQQSTTPYIMLNRPHFRSAAPHAGTPFNRPNYCCAARFDKL